MLRRIRYTFNLRDEKVASILALANCQVSQQQVQRWLLKDDDANMLPLTDIELASFLNGFIIEKRGKKEGKVPEPEAQLSKNLILLKLKIALKLQNEDIIGLLAGTGFTIGKAELTAFFRKPDHKNYRHCKSQFLRNFLQALQDKYRQVKLAKPNHLAHQPKQQTSFHANAKPKPKPKQHYVNPNASVKKKTDSRKVLKLKPEDIYKDS